MHIPDGKCSNCRNEIFSREVMRKAYKGEIDLEWNEPSMRYFHYEYCSEECAESEKAKETRERYKGYD